MPVLRKSCAVSLSILAMTLAAQADFFVFKDGQPMASIILPERASADITNAVGEFRDDLRRGYQVDIPVGQATNLPGRIELVVQERPLETEDDAEIGFPADDVMRIAGGESGVMRAMFFLLEEFAGVRYLYHGEYGTYFPRRAELAIPRKAIKRGSAFRLMRATSLTTSKYPEFYWKWEVRLGAKGGMKCGHDLSRVAFPMKTYREAGQKPDDAIFPIIRGERFLPYKQPASYDTQYWQPCYGGQAARDEAVSNLVAYLKANPQTKSLSLSINDNGGFCECETCLKLDNGGKTPAALDLPNRSASYFSWLNNVVARVSSNFPDVYFSTLAYREGLPPFRLHPKIVPFYCIDFNVNIDPEVMAKHNKLISGVRAASASDRIGFWGYDYGDIFYSLPRIYFAEQQKAMKFFRDNNAGAAFTERSYFTFNEGPKMYLYFKLLENPDLDLEKTLADWCDACVGKEASPYLRQYYEFWEDFWRTKATQTSWWQSRHGPFLSLGLMGTYMYGLKPGDMAHCRQLMEKVVDLARQSGTADQKERAQLQMTCFEWYESAALSCGAGIFSADGTLPDAAAAVKLLRNIPQASKSCEKWKHLPGKTKDWYVGFVFAKAGADKNVVLSSLSSVLGFLADPAVMDELKTLSTNEQCSSTIRFVASNMAKSADDDLSGNLLMGGSFEKEGVDGWTSDPGYGTISRADNVARKGSHSLKCEINREDVTTTKVVLDAKSNTAYYVAARILIPTNQVRSLEGRLQFWGNPTREKGARNNAWPVNRPEISLSPGTWNYVCAIVPKGGNTQDSIRLCIRLWNFERGTAVYVDDVQLFEIP